MLPAQSLKIEMVLPALPAAGMEVMTARLTRALKHRGHTVGITCLEGGGAVADDLVAEGYRVSTVPAPGFRSNLYATRLERWFHDLRPDVVHTHSGCWLKAVRAARRAGIPCVVYTAHGLPDYEPWYMPILARWAARYTDCIVTVSQPLREHLARQASLPRAALHVIANGVDTSRFSPGPRTGTLRTRLGIADDRFVIGNVARLEVVKNHDLLLDAFATLRARVPEATLVIVGEGQLLPTLQQRIAALGLTSHVHLVGSITDVAPAYRDFDLFVLSSRGEGTSMSLLEAMASGVCVAATAVGGTPDLLDHGRCGVLVSAHDPAELAAAMARLVQDVSLRRGLAAAARARIETWYGEASMLRAYEELYFNRLRQRDSSYALRSETR